MAADCLPQPAPSLVLDCWPRETGALVFGVGLNEGHNWHRNQLVYVRHKTSGLEDALGVVLELSSDQKRAKIEIIHIRVGSDPKLLGAMVRPLPKDQEPRLGGAVSRLEAGRNEWERLGVGTADGVRAKDGAQAGSRYRVVDISRDLKEVGFLEVRWVDKLEAQAQWLNPPSAALKDRRHWLALEVPTDRVPQRATLKVLVLNFGATVTEHNQHGESYAAELTRALRGAVCDKDAEGKEVCSIDVVHEPLEKVPPTWSDAEGHKKAKEIGEQHGAALVVWGAVKCTDKGCAQPRMTLVTPEVFAQGERALSNHYFSLSEPSEFKGEIVDHPQRLAQALLGRVMYKAQKYGDASYYLGAAMTEPKMWAYSDLQGMRRNRAYAAFTVGQVTLAQRLAEAMIAAAATEGDAYWQVRGLGERARVYQLVGKIAAAEADLNQIRAQTQDDPGMQSYALHTLAYLAFQQGRVGEAQGLYEKSLALKKSIGNVEGEAATLHQLAGLAEQQGRVGEAQGLYEKSLALEQSIGNVAGALVTQTNLAWLAYQAGQTAQAEATLQEALAAAEARGYVKESADILNLLAQIKFDQGQWAAAQSLGQRAVAGFRQLQMEAEAQAMAQWVALAEDRLQLIKTHPVLARGAVLVSEVLADGPGARVGLMAGDIIYGYDGQPVTSAAALSALTGKTAATATVQLQLVRGAHVAGAGGRTYDSGG